MPEFQHTEWMRGAGHWVATASVLPQASRATQRECSPLHHTQSYWGKAVWDLLLMDISVAMSHVCTFGTLQLPGEFP